MDDHILFMSTEEYGLYSRDVWGQICNSKTPPPFKYMNSMVKIEHKLRCFPYWSTSMVAKPWLMSHMRLTRMVSATPKIGWSPIHFSQDCCLRHWAAVKGATAALLTLGQAPHRESWSSSMLWWWGEGIVTSTRSLSITTSSALQLLNLGGGLDVAPRVNNSGHPDLYSILYIYASIPSTRITTVMNVFWNLNR